MDWRLHYGSEEEGWYTYERRWPFFIEKIRSSLLKLKHFEFNDHDRYRGRQNDPDYFDDGFDREWKGSTRISADRYCGFTNEFVRHWYIDEEIFEEDEDLFDGWFSDEVHESCLSDDQAAIQGFIDLCKARRTGG
ncbi:Hypothetical protein D9617_1g088750 [Elsinoe fawcettii]|nr:Hypothetical protein D9617_1g088750 [Elsinoe fawcettii]